MERNKSKGHTKRGKKIYLFIYQVHVWVSTQSNSSVCLCWWSKTDKVPKTESMEKNEMPTFVTLSLFSFWRSKLASCWSASSTSWPRPSRPLTPSTWPSSKATTARNDATRLGTELREPFTEHSPTSLRFEYQRVFPFKAL